ncbi:MAG: hypothetical protein HQ546_01795 [Planctomycetes bacterium]|nr:hypothetical protein [Planctomycetota bacterium]
MSIETAMAALVEEKQQREAVIEARALFQQARSELQQIDSRIDEIIAAGHFDTIANEIKSPLVAARGVIKTAVAALATGDVDTVLSWKS